MYLARRTRKYVCLMLCVCATRDERDSGRISKLNREEGGTSWKRHFIRCWLSFSPFWGFVDCRSDQCDKKSYGEVSTVDRSGNIQWSRAVYITYISNVKSPLHLVMVKSCWVLSSVVVYSLLILPSDSWWKRALGKPTWLSGTHHDYNGQTLQKQTLD